VDDDGRPILILSADTEETYHIRDAEGKDLDNSAENCIMRVRHVITIQLNEGNEWVVCGWQDQAEKLSW